MKTNFLRLFLITATIFSVSFATAADSLPVVQPEDVGFSSEQLNKIETYFTSRVEKGEIAGIVTLVARHGKIAHFSAVGYQDAEQEIPMEKDTIFRIYSMTKPIVSTALMMLYQDGLFQMNDPLSKFIPEFADLRVLRDPNGPLDETVAMEREPTVQDILRHTAGFSHCLGNSEYDKACVELGLFSTQTSLKEMMTALSKIPLMNQPGSQWRYSIGPDVALRLVEVISGMSADDYLEQKMFDLLGMDDTGYIVNSDNAHRLSPIHWRKDGELVPIDEAHGRPRGGVLAEPWSVNSYTFDHEYKGGSLGLVSTTEDYFRFAQAILNGGKLNGKRLLGPKTVEFMSRNHLSEEQNSTFSPALGFGLGFATIEDATGAGYPASEGTFYWSGAASTYFWIDPVEDIVVVSMTQHMGVRETSAVRGELSALVYGALE
ncbi:MAG: serine hydrolase [Gammaproteobacteria bacterium]|jgi:CubicO group peptidase (beta-lactamase class C family)|nr:serine hydrolase [Gammaproteobacteria bacterium]